MKYARMMFATIGLLAAAGATDAAQDQHNSVTLYTGATHAGKFDCNVVNVSNKTLNIIISIIASEGLHLFDSDTTPTPAGMEVSGDFGDPAVGNDAYCKVQVSGTGDRNDLRVLLNTNLIRTFDQGSQTNIPVFVFRQVEGH
jgi:hypothetical protein